MLNKKHNSMYQKQKMFLVYEQLLWIHKSGASNIPQFINFRDLQIDPQKGTSMALCLLVTSLLTSSSPGYKQWINTTAVELTR